MRVGFGPGAQNKSQSNLFINPEKFNCISEVVSLFLLLCCECRCQFLVWIKNGTDDNVLELLALHRFAMSFQAGKWSKGWWGFFSWTWLYVFRPESSWMNGQFEVYAEIIPLLIIFMRRTIKQWLQFGVKNKEMAPTFVLWNWITKSEFFKMVIQGGKFKL